MRFVHTKRDKDGAELVTICRPCSLKLNEGAGCIESDADTMSVVSDARESQGFRYCTKRSSKKDMMQNSIDMMRRDGEISDEEMTEIDGSEETTALALLDLFSSA
jgi:hypothetical protein